MDDEQYRRAVQAAAYVIVDSALQLIQEDNHYWSERVCPTCKAISILMGHPFGCYVYAANKKADRLKVAR